MFFNTFCLCEPSSALPSRGCMFFSFFPLFSPGLFVVRLPLPSTLDNKARTPGRGRKGKLGIRPRNYLSNFFNVAVSHLALMYVYNFHRRGSGLASNPCTIPGLLMLSSEDERVHLPDGKDQKKSRGRAK